ncbi:formate dehydrogenase [Rubrobacter taiwanensis]|jgi:anaerobic selenocysteine-containing dehydrogenase|uniref:Formate dehydrogenase n=1 Tax=Rubrobacter taiwanensis TaxID=185139 RepID=A0A4R1BHZ8_9ACTN|nr:molybdopterin-dependent oxidoreductase [Rubrobacter taiwanensis]TCJ16879.1 formate dehydrogenase [Rubrobacter taiwanensis]
MALRKEPERSLIERIATKLGVIPNVDQPGEEPERLVPGSALVDYPPPRKWDDWEEYEARGWTRRQKRRYQIVPTVCFNCEAACGLLAYIDRESGEIRKFEGHPLHPGSRGRNCAKGPATINQVKDPERVLYPMKRKGPRGGGEWERVSWEEVLEDLAARIRKAIREDRRDEVMYHVGRPGFEHQHMERVFRAWGVDAHNSHTNVCSSSGRFGYQLWGGFDRPSPDYANARATILVSSHLESGHYFNPHAQRIIEGKMKGAKLIVIDPRLSNSAAMADYWLPARPGTEPALLLAMAYVILREELYDADFIRDWTNWPQYMRELHPDRERTFENFIEALRADYARFTPQYAEQECGIPAAKIVEVARVIGHARPAVAAHNWRAAAAANLGGWQVSRCLVFLNVLTGSWGRRGGTNPNGWNKWLPHFWKEAPPQKAWNRLTYPDEYPLAQYEMSFLLPYFLMEGRGRLEVYFSRVLNPVWTYPDGFAWIEALTNEEYIGCHAALTPTWNETAYFADYVLPLGHGPERHDLMSQETHSGKWLSFRQPVLREAARRRGEEFTYTYEVNPGEVWEDDEFWIELSWRIDPDGSMGIREHFESPYRPGEKLTVEEYYRWIFENAVPGLPERAAEEGLSPLEYMRRYGAFEIQHEVYERNMRELSEEEVRGARLEEDGTLTTEESRTQGVIRANRLVPHVGVQVAGRPREGFPTLSGKLEIWSPTMAAWGWPEHATPGYIKSHVHPENLEEGQLVLNATFRLPTLIHTRSGNSKWLNEISNKNPLWIHPKDAGERGIETGDLVRVVTEIGYSVNHAWVTEGIAPGVVACSHHLGRWRRKQDRADRWSNSLVDITREEGGWRLRQLEGPAPYESSDPDTRRIFWSDGGVHQNLTFPVHPDPISGMHCWHQAVYVEKAREGDRYGDIYVDTARSLEVYRRWLAMTRPGPLKNGLRRPEVFDRPYRPAREVYLVDKK